MNTFVEKLKKAENIFTALLAGLVTLLPFIQLVIERWFGIPIMDIDNIQVNLVFLFSCFAFIVTWRYNKHLSISITDNVENPILKKIITAVRELTIPAILVVLFFSSFSEFFGRRGFSGSVLGIPAEWFFIFLPIAFLSMLVMVCSRSEHLLYSIIGIICGLIISTGPLSGVLYYLFGAEDLNFLYAFSDVWNSFAGVSIAFWIVFFIVAAFFGVPLFIVLSGVSYICFSQGGGYVEVISQETYTALSDLTTAAIPLFTICGYILSRGSAGKRLVSVFGSLMGSFRGGTVIATVLVCTFFTTFTGVSGVTILALGSLLTIALTGSGYDEEKAQSLITSSGAVGLLFPPSVAIIIYFSTNIFSMNDAGYDAISLFVGALIPGLLLAIGMIGLGAFFDKNKNRSKFSGKKAILSLKNSAFELLMPVFILWLYFGGAFTLYQTAAFAVVYAFILEVFIRKDFTIKKAVHVIIESLPVTGGVLCIIGAAKGLSYFIMDASIPELITESIVAVVHSKILFLLLVNVVLLFVGCLMDIYSAILIVSPIVITVADSFGIDPVHMGVIFILNMQMGFLTPPVGMDLFISSYAFNKPVMKIARNILPFLLVQFTVLMLVTYVPWLSTALLGLF